MNLQKVKKKAPNEVLSLEAQNSWLRGKDLNL